MEYKKTLLGAASLLALTAAIPATASIAPLDAGMKGEPAGLVGSVNEDPLFEFVRLTKGSLTPASVEAALGSIFSEISPARLETLPQFLTSLAGMGLSGDLLERARDVLNSIAAGSNASSEARDWVVAQLNAGPSPIVLAQNTRRQRDPNATGQVPGGGGGGGGGGTY